MREAPDPFARLDRIGDDTEGFRFRHFHSSRPLVEPAGVTDLAHYRWLIFIKVHLLHASRLVLGCKKVQFDKNKSLVIASDFRY